MDSFDFVVVGGGSAGYAAARTAVSFGLSTAIVDSADELGGLCILRGCMPSKTLIATANRARTIRQADEFAINATFNGVSGSKLRERKRRFIDDFAGYRKAQLTDGRFALFRGHGKFTGKTELSVSMPDGSAKIIAFKTALIATGSRVQILDIPGLAETGFWTSDDALDSDYIPRSIVVLGGGAIALELAHFYEGVGSQVTVIQRSPHVLRGMDEDLAHVVEVASRERGITLHTGTKINSVSRKDGMAVVHYEHTGHGSREATGEILLLATGRVPTTENLGADIIDVIDNANGRIKTTHTQQTPVPHIFAAGDASGPADVVHVAIQQGEIAARNAARMLGKLGGDLEKYSDHAMLFGVFTEPEVAQVGITEAQARRDGKVLRVATYPFNDHGKSMVEGVSHGFVKLLAEPGTGKLVGASVVGPHATELIHEMALAVHLGLTAAQIATAPHYHPTLSEIWAYPAEELMEG
ncbi:MAG: NAD(P)/FAD-dependent oxidoreductase [Puniceicoccales bacterium]|jgi:pyruvate/2-oxoglutarate dehydrogenase complex dihydrolipoamide dehydrogenase (E3) component|nr:NAD(P)/FAD-dependent oxidoreductase [Puniceicoccales bacterium]